MTDDQSQIAQLVRVFFAAFTSGPDLEARLDGLREDGAHVTGGGAKSIQLVRAETGWRISALVWDDERP